jgi:hypothetical protein
MFQIQGLRGIKWDVEIVANVQKLKNLNLQCEVISRQDKCAGKGGRVYVSRWDTHQHIPMLSYGDWDSIPSLQFCA